MMKDDNVTGDLKIAASQLYKERTFWKDKLSVGWAKSYFPYDSGKKVGTPRNTDVFAFRFSETLAERAIQLSGGSDPRLHMVLTAGMAALMNMYVYHEHEHDHENVIICTSIDKQEKEIEDSLLNTILPLRIIIKDNMTFKELLVEVKNTINEAVENQNYPIADLVKEMDMAASILEFPLFETFIILENIQDKKYIRHIANILIFSFLRTDQHIEGEVEYNAAFYEKPTIQRIINYYLFLLEKVLFDVDIMIREIEMIGEEDIRQFMAYNDTYSQYPSDKTIHQLFEEQVERTPCKLAVIDGDQCFTYRELNGQSNRLAHALRQRGVRPGIYVGILAQRSLEFLVALLAVLKAGGAYIPIDTEYPEERRDYLMDHSSAPILLTQAYLKPTLTNKKDILEIESFTAAGSGADITNPLPTARSNHPAYVIYTSGSTGKPKGVVVEHRGLVNYICWAANTYVKNQNLNFPLFTSISFDLTVTSIFTPLITGNAVVIYQGEQGEILDQRLINENKVGIVKLTPSHLNLIKNKKVIGTGIKCFILGGEALEVQITREIYENFAGKIEIYNEYGPTEATVGCMICKFDPLNQRRLSVPIGTPAANMQIHLLDKRRKPVPVGAVGEIYIFGPGLAQGYLNNPELTSGTFIKSKFQIPNKAGYYRSHRSYKSYILYKTGDLARWLPNQTLEFSGRVDQQVKIRGYRIELGEIENLLLEHDDIKDAIVIERKTTVKGYHEDDITGNNKYLCAYVVSGRELTVQELREYLSRELPHYMLPSYFVPMETIPLTAHGKLNVKLLPDPVELIETGLQYQPPSTEIETILTGIWQDVLKVDKIGIDDNYFSLGGDSINAMQIASRLKKFRLKLDLKYLYRYPNIRELANYVQSTKEVSHQGIVEGEVKLTPIQEWFFEKEGIRQRHFNLSVMLHASGGFKEEILEKVFKKLLEHHDALRIGFQWEGDEARQINRGIRGDLFNMTVYDFSKETNYKKRIRETADVIQTSVKLNDGGPLIKLGLFKTGNGHYLLIAVHHLLIDTVSWRILLEDLDACYKQAERGGEIELPLKTTPYKEWAEKLHQYAANEKILTELDYWKKLEKTILETLPKDCTPKENRIKNNKRVSFALSEEDTEKLLKEVNKAYNTETNDILLTALAIALNQWAGIEKTLIHLEGHGREEIIKGIDITRTVGWFTSIYPVVIDVKNSSNLTGMIKDTKEMLRRVPNKGIGYGILKYLTTRDKKQGIKFELKPEVGFNYLGQFDEDLQTDLFHLADISAGDIIDTQFEKEHALDLMGMILTKKMEILVEYNKEAFRENNISTFIDILETSLKGIINHCIAQGESESTPSDFTSNDFDEEEVDSIIDELEESLSL